MTQIDRFHNYDSHPGWKISKCFLHLKYVVREFNLVPMKWLIVDCLMFDKILDNPLTEVFTKRIIGKPMYYKERGIEVHVHFCNMF